VVEKEAEREERERVIALAARFNVTFETVLEEISAPVLEEIMRKREHGNPLDSENRAGLQRKEKWRDCGEEQRDGAPFFRLVCCAGSCFFAPQLELEIAINL
jgi:predicted kinase